MNFLIFGCKHDRILILVSIPTFSRFSDIENDRINYVISTVDLGTQGHTFLLYDLVPLWLITSYKLYLGVDCTIFNGEDLRNLWINNMNLDSWPWQWRVDTLLGIQGHTYLLYDLASLWVITSYKLDHGIDCNIFVGANLRNPYINYMDSIFDLGNESKTHICMTFLFLYLKT